VLDSWLKKSDRRLNAAFFSACGLSEKTAKSQFLILPLDVPPPPLFTDDLEKSIIPQVPLFELLNKYDGVTEKASLWTRVWPQF